LNKDEQSYEAHGYHASLGNEAVLGRITFTQFTLRFEFEGGLFEAPLKELTVRKGRGRDERIFFYHPQQPEWKIASPDSTILSHHVFTWNNHLRNQVTAMAGPTIWRNAIVTTVGFCAAFGLACVLLVSSLGWIVRAAVNRIPPAEERALGDKIYAAAKTELPIMHDEEKVARLNRIFEKLRPGLPDTNMMITFHIVDMSIPNAFSIPGHILVTRGLFDLINSPDELAGVLAHELGHIHRKHIFQKILASYGPAYILKLAFRNSRGVVATIAENSQVVLGRSFDRGYEREADDEGWKYLVAAKINPRGMIDMLHAFQNFEHDYELARHSEVLSTHPPTDVRIERLEAHWNALKEKEDFVHLTWSAE